MTTRRWDGLLNTLYGYIFNRVESEIYLKCWSIAVGRFVGSQQSLSFKPCILTNSSHAAWTCHLLVHMYEKLKSVFGRTPKGPWLSRCSNGQHLPRQIESKRAGMTNLLNFIMTLLALALCACYCYSKHLACSSCHYHVILSMVSHYIWITFYKQKSIIFISSFSHLSWLPLKMCCKLCYRSTTSNEVKQSNTTTHY